MSRKWTEIELTILRRYYPDHITRAVADAVGRTEHQVRQQAYRLGIRKSQAYLQSNAARFLAGSNAGAKTRFRKGQEPWNKGLKGYQPNNHEHRFRPGNIPHTYRPIGSYRITKDGVLVQKISDEKGPTRVRWRGVHELVWVAANGPVPEGHIVVFKPGRRTTDPNEITIDAVECVSRAENLNRNSLHRYPEEIVGAIRARAVLNRRINHVEKHQRPTRGNV